MLKNKAFEKLRLAPKVATAVASVGMALGVAALPAKAVTVGLPLAVNTGNAGWGRSTQGGSASSYNGINNASASMVVTAGGLDSDDPAYRIGEAYLITGGGSLTDAFDSFGGIRVNGTFFQQPSAQVDRTTTGAGTFLNTITPQNIGGINTSLDYFFDQSSPTARVLATFTNTTGSSQAVNVLYGGNLGSDNDTIIESSSSGDAVFQQADRWFVSSDQGFGDPVLTFVRYGTGSVQTASNTFAVPGTDSGNGDVAYFTDVWDLNIDPGETQRLMWFVQLSETVATAVTNAATTFTNLTSLDNGGLLEGLSTSQQSEIVNWQSQQTPPPTTPEPSTLLGLGSLLLLGGFSKRKSKKTENNDNSGDLG